MNDEKEEYRTFGQILFASRIASGLSQTELGRELGEAQATISAWERGVRFPKNNGYKKMRLQTIADLFSIDLSELWSSLLRSERDARFPGSIKSMSVSIRVLDVMESLCNQVQILPTSELLEVLIRNESLFNETTDGGSTQFEESRREIDHLRKIVKVEGAVKFGRAIKYFDL
jgi:transcriptional regulator with XRE-family HTH domain